MKKVMIAAAVIAGLLSNGTFAADLKIGVVNLQRCFEEYYKTKQADSMLKEDAEAYNKERQERIGAFTKTSEERNKLLEEIKKPELSEAAKKDKEKESEAKLADLRKMEAAIREYDNVRRQSLKEASDRMRGTIVKEITEQVVKISKSQNFTVVLDSSGASMNGTAILVYSEDRLDITQDVIRELNRNAPPPEPAKPAGGSKTNQPPKPAAK